VGSGPDIALNIGIQPMVCEFKWFTLKKPPSKGFFTRFAQFSDALETSKPPKNIF
jgi:hypothetical protein